MRLVVRAETPEEAVAFATWRGFRNVTYVPADQPLIWSHKWLGSFLLDVLYDQWRAIDWFCEGKDEAPFPAGTCLWYSAT